MWTEWEKMRISNSQCGSRKTILVRWLLYLLLQPEGKVFKSCRRLNFVGRTVNYGPLNWPIVTHVLNEIYNNMWYNFWYFEVWFFLYNIHCYFFFQSQSFLYLIFRSEHLTPITSQYTHIYTRPAITEHQLTRYAPFLSRMWTHLMFHPI